MVSVCPACKTEFDGVFQEPLDDVEFSQLLGNLQINELSVLGLDWGASREVAEKGLRPDLNSGRLPGRSRNILSTVLNVGRAEAQVSFIFKENALDHLMLAPRKAVLDAETPLVQLYGPPSMRMDGLGPDETTTQWRTEGLEINLVETTRRILNVIFYPGSRVLTSPVKPGLVEDDAPPTAKLEIELEDLSGEGWVTLDGGTFTMGSKHGEDHETPTQQVTLSQYHISRYPVTNRQYLRFVTETGKEAPWYWTEAQIPEGRESHPVMYVSWEEAEAFCIWLTMTVGKGVVSLPTEAQWEFAARGPEGREYPWGAEEPDANRANFGGTKGGTTSVDAYPGGATPTGIYDLAGNVWEWCRDLYGPYSADSITDPTGPNEGRSRVLRGGSFGFWPSYLRAAVRRCDHPVYQFVGVGFRVVWSGA